LAVIDLPNVYVPEHENANLSQAARRGSVSATVSDLKARSINSSYGATYYPWVQIRDTINDQNVWVPPSVVSLGALSYGQRTQALWFAPAGFTRGGLSEGRGGVPVLAVSQRLNSRERDSLYEANINPIAQFPAEGIVIFGQKTLQVTPSALDRINVRRLLIYLKREISIISSRLLFDQNVEVTWNRFLSQVNPFLQSVQSNLGLTDYRVILDETTTTPDLVDRNVMYAKIYLKPARAIEFIALDFVITNSGASFAD
jgi:phage tail sheath protein FI